MNKKKGHKDRINKKIRYIRAKRPARINLNAELKKMIEDIYA